MLEDIFNAAVLGQRRSCGNPGEQLVKVGVGIGFPHEPVEGVEIQPQVQIMDESLLLVTYVHESGIQGREQFLDSSEEDVSHRECVTLTGFFAQLNEPAVFQQGQLNFG